jgi:hypothetical protein
MLFSWRRGNVYDVIYYDVMVQHIMLDITSLQIEIVQLSKFTTPIETHIEMFHRSCLMPTSRDRNFDKLDSTLCYVRRFCCKSELFWHNGSLEGDIWMPLPTFCILVIFSPLRAVRIRVRIGPPCPLASQKRRLNGEVLWMITEKPRSHLKAGVAL